MKKYVMFLMSGLILMSAGTSFACHITFAPREIEDARVGDVITVEAIVTKEHRRCVLEDTDVQVELSDNIKIVNETGWQTTGSKEIHNTFEIQILAEGDTRLRVFRDCSKKGASEGILIFPAVM